jgi:uncharacterized protein involved in exopolysaccharide biosynthesis
MQDEHVDLADVAARLSRHWLPACATALAVTATVVAWSILYAERSYLVVATILPVTQEASPLNMAGSGIPTASLLSSVGLGGPAEPTRRYLAILRSRSALEHVARDAAYLAWRVETGGEVLGGGASPADIARALVVHSPHVVRGRAPEAPEEGILSMPLEDLRARVADLPGLAGASDDYDAIRAAWYRRVERYFGELRSGIRVRIDQDGLVSVEVELPHDPNMPATIANALVSHLATYLDDATLTNSRQAREFVGRRLGDVELLLANAEAGLSAYKAEKGIVSLPEHIAATVARAATVQGRLFAKRIERDALLAGRLPPGNVRMQAVEGEVSGLETELWELEYGGGTFLARTGLADLPRVEVEYTALMRATTVAGTLHALLAQQYELAKIEEARDNPSFQVLDAAQPPARPHRPRHVANALIGSFLGSCLGLSIAAVLARGVGSAGRRRTRRESP